MKDLLAIITPDYADASEHAAHYAFSLAALGRAHVTVLIPEIEPYSPARIERAKELVQSAANRADVTCTVLPEFNAAPVRETLVDRAQVRDIVTINVRGALRYPRQGLVEAVLFGSGRPIILVPPGAHAPAGARALIAWDSTRSAARALHDALPILTHSQEVVVVSVAQDKEIRGFRTGDEVCHYLGRWGIQARFELLQRGSRNVGDVLLSHAAKIEAALVVMGGFGQAREREFLFGSATRDIFKSALETAVLLSH